MKMIFKLQIIVYSIFILFIDLCIRIETFAQDDNRQLAKVGNQIIRVDEFRTRYDFMPHLNYSNDNPDTLKKEFLYSLIAEKLWALEALEKGLDTIDFVKYSIKTLEKLFVKDVLFRNEVESKIILTAEEIAKGTLNVARTLFLKVITSNDSSEIFSIHRNLIDGTNFDSILIRRPEYNSQQIPFILKLGVLTNQEAEEKIFNLNYEQISDPIKSNLSWYIFKVIDEEIDSSLINDSQTARNKTISIFTERKRRILAGNFLDNLLGGRTISANKELFNYFSEFLIKTLNQKHSNSITDTNKNFELIPSELLNFLKISDKEKLNSIFVEFDEIKLTLKDFIYYLMYQKINFTSLKSNKIKSTLNSTVKQFIEDEIITQEGYKRGFNNLSYVKNEVEMWRIYYLSELMLQSFSDSVKVNEQEIAEYLSQNNQTISNPILLNIIEIFNEQLDQIMIALDELSKGSDFREVAKKFNQRQLTKQSDGEWGYFLSKSAGQIGKIASEMEVGKVYGPIKVEDGYSIFKLIDKKKLVDSTINLSDTPKEYLKMKLSLKKINELINKNTLNLSIKYGVEINENLLNEIEVSSLNMFTYKLIGFGGKIAAMPIVIPVFEWYYLLKNKSVIP